MKLVQLKKKVAISFRSSHQKCSMKKGIPRNFTKFTGKRLCQSLFLNKVVGLSCRPIKRETLAQGFSCEFCESSKNTFFTEHDCFRALWRLATENPYRSAWKTFAVGKSVSIIVCRNILSNFREHQVEQPKQLLHLKKPLTVKLIRLSVQFGFLELISHNPMFFLPFIKK